MKYLGSRIPREEREERLWMKMEREEEKKRCELELTTKILRAPPRRPGA